MPYVNRCHALCLLFVFPSVAGCALQHDNPAEEQNNREDVHLAPNTQEHSPSTPPVKLAQPPDTVEPTRLEQCLLDGGSLFEHQSVNNNDTMNHGDVLSLAVSDDRTLAVGTESSIKLWDFSTAVVPDGPSNVLREAQFDYGVERPGGAVALVFEETHLLAATSAGIVNRWFRQEDALWAEPVGGASPGTPLRDLAISPDRTHIAYVSSEGVVVRSKEEVFELQLAGANDSRYPTNVRFLNDRTLVAFGYVDDHAFVPENFLGIWTFGEDDYQQAAMSDFIDWQSAAATAPEGGSIAVATSTRIGVFADDLEPIFSHERQREDAVYGRNVVSLSRHGLVLFNVHGLDFTPAIEVLDGKTGAALTSFPYADLVVDDIRRNLVAMAQDPQGEYLFVAHRNGDIRALGCQP